ncbi:MAG: LysM peptidoglycan-binding domain-containing protein [Verrucomicrobiota bacterium]
MKTLVFQMLLDRRIYLLAAGFLLPILLTQCKSTGGSYQDIAYDPSTLKTPSGHGMEKKEYPFDDEGRYRKEWVKNKATGKTRSASKLPDNDTAVAELPGTISAAPPAAAGYYGPAESAVSTPTYPTEVASVSPPSSSISEARYHKVVSGDTLYSLSQQYGSSVAELKRVNGLSGDTIRTGQSLRLP